MSTESKAIEPTYMESATLFGVGEGGRVNKLARAAQKLIDSRKQD